MVSFARVSERLNWVPTSETATQIVVQNMTFKQGSCGTRVACPPRAVPIPDQGRREPCSSLSRAVRCTSLIALVGLLIAVFVLTRLTGDPAALYLPEEASAEQRAAYAVQMGYSDPIYMQFFRYVEGLLRFDFGISMRQQRSAMIAVFEAVPTTLLLSTLALTITVTVAVTVGTLAASRPGGLFDRLATTLSLAGASAPDFWIAIVGILLFAVALGWLPTSGIGGPAILGHAGDRRRAEAHAACSPRWCAAP